MNLNAIILRDIPKEEVRIDLYRQNIQGGFRGFYADFPLMGWHYVSVKVDEFHVGFWCRLAMGEAVVRVFDTTEGFVEDEPETAQHYAQLALSGAMNQSLVAYPDHLYAPWFGLVSYLDSENFPPQLHSQEVGAGSRFDQALQGTHGGNTQAFLAEFQYAFVSWLISLDAATENEAAFERWQHLLLSIYNAGEDRIRQAGKLFASLVGLLIRQFNLLPQDWFEAGSFLVEQANYMVEDMIDTEVEELVKQGRVFGEYLQRRKQDE